MMGVVVLMLPMLPDVELKDIDVVPAKFPVVSVIAPLPLVFRLTIVPLAL